MDYASNKWLLFLLFTLLLMVPSCNRHRIKHYIKQEMRDQDTLVFDLQDLFKEKIDSVYVLCDITPAWWISEIIGIEYDKSILSDDEQRIILVSGKGILYSESLTWSGWSRVLWNGPTNHSKKKKQVIVRKVNKDAILPYYLIDMSDDG